LGSGTFVDVKTTSPGQSEGLDLTWHASDLGRRCAHRSIV
jgi:hypothetical protein